MEDEVDRPVRVLVLCGDYWHPPRNAREGLAPLGADDFVFDWIEDAHEWPAERMAGYPVIVLAKSNNASSVDRTPWVTPEVESAFRDYVQRGGGLLVVHSGSSEYSEAPVLRGLLGGVFASHPRQCPVTVQPVAAHPVTAGVDPFTVFDEHYFMEMDDTGAEVSLTTTSEHGAQPGGWTRTEGEGRVCLLTPGHNLEVWLHPCYQTLLRNALRWCCASGLRTEG
ncbi:MAG: ThuA domain-containing protein [Chloroflexia bacterium]